jgi:phosphoribosylpyrophosphate synthetase
MIVADSIDTENKKLPAKFTVLSCSNLFGEAIMRISGEKSVSSLFNDLPV